jgi:hypothetical protein
MLQGPFSSRSLVEPSRANWPPFPGDTQPPTAFPTVAHETSHGTPVTAWPGLLITDAEALEFELSFHEVPSAALLGICDSACAVWGNSAADLTAVLGFFDPGKLLSASKKDILALGTDLEASGCGVILEGSVTGVALVAVVGGDELSGGRVRLLLRGFP